MAGSGGMRGAVADRVVFNNAAVVTLCIGDPSKNHLVVVHRKILSRSSAYFRTLCAGESAKKHTSRKLPDLDPLALDVYIDWLYSGTIKTKYEDTAICTHGRSPLVEDDEYCALATVYRLGRKLEDDVFANAVMDVCLEKLANDPCAGVSMLPGCHCIEIIYSEPQYIDDMAKNAVLDAFVRAGKPAHFDDMDMYVPTQFLRDLSRNLLASRRWVAPEAGETAAEPCKYHMHPGGLDCNEERARKRRRTDE